ncbi:MAG: tetratricopeptide repeat protein [Rubrobacter sp.]|nr:tetratricopeptide repeat protein [Rubrobacter sp.]
MMLDRDKISFWTKVGAITLAAIFVGSFLFMGIGTGLNYSFLDLLSGPGKQEEQTTGSEGQIAKAEKDFEDDPQNPRVIKRLGVLYLQEGQTDKAAEVLEKGRKVDPQDPVLPLYLGQAYEKQAQGLSDEEKRKATYKEAGDAYTAAAEAQKNKPQMYLLAGQAYEQAGEKGKAIQYWNEYLKLEPEGEQADAVKERIGTLLKGGETTGGAGGAKR